MDKRPSDQQRADKPREPTPLTDAVLKECAQDHAEVAFSKLRRHAWQLECKLSTARSAGTASVDLTKLDVMKLYDEAFESTFPTLHGEPRTVPVLQVMALREFARRLVGAPRSASEEFVMPKEPTGAMLGLIAGEYDEPVRLTRQQAETVYHAIRALCRQAKENATGRASDRKANG